MRPPTITPTAAKKIRSSTSIGRQPEFGCAARLRPSHHATAKPMTYMSPYQRTASGPTEKMIGSICGYGIMNAHSSKVRIRKFVSTECFHFDEYPCECSKFEP